MRVFVYEFVTGGGWWTVDERKPPGGSLLREGYAMLRSLVADFALIGEVSALCDVRCQLEIERADIQFIASANEERQRFADNVQQSDWTVVIAPEFGSHLSTRCEWVERLGGRLLSPNLQFVAVASDKHHTATRLSSAAVTVPYGCVVSVRQPAPAGFPFPAVIKPRDGAGSLDVRFVRDWQEAREAMDPSREYRLEEFHPGLPASVAVLSGPAGFKILPACRQYLSENGKFEYLGGMTPLPEPLCRRAAVLARAVVAAMPSTVGFFGIDFVLGHEDNGSRDVVIEVNPRLTTSYLGLRKIARNNLAEAMVLVALGEGVDLSFDPGPVQFAAD